MYHMEKTSRAAGITADEEQTEPRCDGVCTSAFDTRLGIRSVSNSSLLLCALSFSQPNIFLRHRLRLSKYPVTTFLHTRSTPLLLLLSPPPTFLSRHSRAILFHSISTTLASPLPLHTVPSPSTLLMPTSLRHQSHQNGTSLKRAGQSTTTGLAAPASASLSPTQYMMGSQKPCSSLT